jgi:hypothetical protein
MKLFGPLAFFVLSLNLSSCTTSNEKARNPASDMKVLSDRYGDFRVYFCTEKMAVVTVDPNRCGETMAKGGSGCTELAAPPPQQLEVVKNSLNVVELRNKNGTAEYRILGARAPFRLESTSERDQRFDLNWYTLTNADKAMFKFSPVCP